MAGILEISPWEFKICCEYAKGSKRKREHMEKHIDNVSKEIKTPRKNQKEILEIKKRKLTKIKHGFDERSSKLDTTKEGISKLADMWTEIFQTTMWREKKLME